MMNKTIAPALFLAVLYSCTVFSAEQQVPQDTYTLDPSHTYVLWHIDHFGFSEPSGKWLAQGKLSFDKDKLVNGKVNVTINVGDFITGISKLDEHLKSKDFFDVANFPTATFVSDKVDSTDSRTAQVDGILTVKGISKPVTVNVVINKMALSPLTQKYTIGFSGNAKIKRSDFGIVNYLPGLSDDVTLEIQGEAALDK